MNSETTASVSRLAVPLPITMVLMRCLRTRRASSRLVPAVSRRGGVGYTTPWSSRVPYSSSTATLQPVR